MHFPIPRQLHVFGHRELGAFSGALVRKLGALDFEKEGFPNLSVGGSTPPGCAISPRQGWSLTGRLRFRILAAASRGEPLAQASRPYPELTVIGVGLGAIQGVIMTAAFVYIALKLGFGIPGSTVAAIIGFTVLRGILRRKSIDALGGWRAGRG